MSLAQTLTLRLHFILTTINTSSRKYAWIAILILSITQIGQIINGDWTGDFWEHCAVLRELIREPVNPTHPIISSSLPHAFFSPYLVMLGFIGHWTNASPILMLSLAAIVNLVLWLYGLFLFVKTFYPDQSWTVYFYLLIFHLFLWGPLPWIYSSFFHFSTLSYVLPYPSTFAVALVFISIYSFSKLPSCGNKRIPFFIALILILNTIILLTHPTSYLLTLAVYAAIVLKQLVFDRDGSNLILALFFVSIPFGAAYFWSYYTLYDLLFSQGDSSQFHTDSIKLYQLVLIRIAPVLLVFFILGNKLHNDKTILILLLTLIIIYLWGIISKQYGYGRVISFIVLIIHLMVSHYLASLISVTKRDLIAVIGAFLLSIPFIFDSGKRLYHNFPFAGENSYSPYQALEKYLGHEDVVVSDRGRSRLIPAFGGKVIGSVFPPYWIEDNSQRLNDMDLFFSDNSSAQQRHAILRKYKADYILIGKRHEGLLPKILDSLKLDGRAVVYKGNTFLLVKCQIEL